MHRTKQKPELRFPAKLLFCPYLALIWALWNTVPSFDKTDNNKVEVNKQLSEMIKELMHRTRGKGNWNFYPRKF